MNSVLPENLEEIGGDFAAEVHHLVGDRVAKFYLLGVQAEALAGIRARVVARIAGDGMPDMLHVNANLIASAGVELEGDEAVTAGAL